MARLFDMPRAAPAVILAGLTLTACASGPRAGLGPQASAPAAGVKIGKPYQVNGRWYTPRPQPDYDETGVGSWYGEQFHNRYTANGEVFDMARVSAAHTTLPLPSLVEVTNLENGRKLVVRVNDRGPFVGDRIIDLSREAARELGYERQGVARVRVRYLGPAPAKAAEPRTWQASAPIPPPQAAPRAVKVAAAPPAMRIQPAPEPTQAGPEYLPDLRPAARWSSPLPPAPTATAPYRIQAAAFADRARAEQAASILSSAGRAEILPVERDGVILYRVQVVGQGEAFAARDQVAALGYGDARILPTD